MKKIDSDEEVELQLHDNSNQESSNDQQEDENPIENINQDISSIHKSCDFLSNLRNRIYNILNEVKSTAKPNQSIIDGLKSEYITFSKCLRQIKESFDWVSMSIRDSNLNFKDFPQYTILNDSIRAYDGQNQEFLKILKKICKESLNQDFSVIVSEKEKDSVDNEIEELEEKSIEKSKEIPQIQEPIEEQEHNPESIKEKEDVRGNAYNSLVHGFVKTNKMMIDYDEDSRKSDKSAKMIEMNKIPDVTPDISPEVRAQFKQSFKSAERSLLNISRHSIADDDDVIPKPTCQQTGLVYKKDKFNITDLLEDIVINQGKIAKMRAPSIGVFNNNETLHTNASENRFAVENVDNIQHFTRVIIILTIMIIVVIFTLALYSYLRR